MNRKKIKICWGCLKEKMEILESMDDVSPMMLDRYLKDHKICDYCSTHNPGLKKAKKC